jgi:hypothetical protein
MRFIRSAATTLTLAGKMAFAGIATLAAFTVPALTTPAFALGLPVDVSPSTATPGESVTVSVTCPSGSVSATLDGTNLGLGSQIQMTGSMPGASQFATTVKLPASISPGTYSPSVDCNPSGPSGPANITVTPSAPAVAHVSPPVAAPGNNVNVVVVCGAGATSATFYGTSLGLPQMPMAQSTSPGQFSATVGLPANISPGTYAPSITCNNQNNQVTNNVTTSITVNAAPPPPAPVAHVSPQVAAPGNNVNVVAVCGAGATSATFYGTTLGSPQIPMTPTSNHHFSATVPVPMNISPGTYSPSITCNNQNNQVTNNVTTSITINPAPGPPLPVGPPLPIGPPLTGDGATSSVTGGPFALAGVALLGTGGLAVGAGVIRKRRRSGTRTGGDGPTR